MKQPTASARRAPDAHGEQLAGGNSMVRVEELVKRYPKQAGNAVDGMSFEAAAGEVFGLLGPNGAGKSTTIGVLTTRVLPTAGRALISGVDVARKPVLARSKLSVVPQRPNFDQVLSARQNLVFHAAYHGLPRGVRARRADQLLELFGLTGHANDEVARFSGGMQQRLLIARALMHGPQVLFLDEPSTGLDPAARLFIWDRVRELKDAGLTVVLTTHDMDEAAQLSDRVGIVDHGSLLALDTPGALTRSLPGSATLELRIEYGENDDAERMVEVLAAVEGVQRVERLPVAGSGSERDLRVRLYLTGEAASAIAPVTTVVAERKASLHAVSVGEPSLEDVFINLTGRDLR